MKAYRLHEHHYKMTSSRQSPSFKYSHSILKALEVHVVYINQEVLGRVLHAIKTICVTLFVTLLIIFHLLYLYIVCTCILFVLIVYKRFLYLQKVSRKKKISSLLLRHRPWNRNLQGLLNHIKMRCFYSCVLLFNFHCVNSLQKSMRITTSHTASSTSHILQLVLDLGVLLIGFTTKRSNKVWGLILSFVILIFLFFSFHYKRIGEWMFKKNSIIISMIHRHLRWRSSSLKARNGKFHLDG